jgi:hypothetical protein
MCRHNAEFFTVKKLVNILTTKFHSAAVRSLCAPKFLKLSVDNFTLRCAVVGRFQGVNSHTETTSVTREEHGTTRQWQSTARAFDRAVLVWAIVL